MRGNGHALVVSACRCHNVSQRVYLWAVCETAAVGVATYLRCADRFVLATSCDVLRNVAPTRKPNPSSFMALYREACFSQSASSALLCSELACCSFAGFAKSEARNSSPNATTTSIVDGNTFSGATVIDAFVIRFANSCFRSQARRLLQQLRTQSRVRFTCWALP